MRKAARTVLCGGCSVMGVPTARSHDFLWAPARLSKLQPLSATVLVLAAAHTRRLTFKVAACAATPRLSSRIGVWRMSSTQTPPLSSPPSLPVDEPVRLRVFPLAGRIADRRALASPLCGSAQDLPAPALHAARSSDPGPVPSSHLGRIEFDRMTATLAAYDQPDWGRGCAAKRHRLGGLGWGPRVTTRSASASAAFPGEDAAWFRNGALTPG